MKKITWLGEDRVIPKYGSVTKGSEISLPAYIADSFIKQKLAKVSKKTNQPNEERS